MAILIKNMDIPKSCWHCQLSSSGESGRFYCDVTLSKIEMSSEKRETNCPLKEVFTDKWIPASERLPEASGWYLVTIEDNVFNVRKVELAVFRQPNDYYIDAGEWSCLPSFDDKVLAWMPLPQPYYESNEDKQIPANKISCKDCKYHKEYHYEDKGEKPYIKSVCTNKHGLNTDYQIHDWDYCSRAERRTQNENNKDDRTY